MANSSLAKLNKLSEAVRDSISQADILAELDNLDENFGIKSTSILIDLLLRDIDYANLTEYLKATYDFNQFLAEQIKSRFGALVEKIGQTVNEKADAGPAVNNSHLTFSREDEAEVEKYKQQASTATVIDYEIIAANIINRLNLNLADDVLFKRLRNIIIARLKQVRDDLETKEILMKSNKVGGMEFSETQAEVIITALKNYDLNTGESKTRRPALPRPVRVTAPETIKVEEKSPAAAIHIEEEDGLPVIKFPGAALPQTLTEALPAVVDTKNEPTFEKSLPVSGQHGKIMIESESSGQQVSVNQAPMPAVASEKLPAPSPAPYVASQHIPETVLNSKNANKPNLDDVRFEKRLMGPIEELENMTLIDFRRLAADPNAAVNKIKEKIELLGEESFSKRLEGITAWHKNEVNKFYRLLGQSAMTEGKNMEETVRERLLAGKPTLSIDELHAVMELNRALRF